MLLGGAASGAQARTAAGTGSEAAAPYKVGIVYSRTGLLSAYGAEYIQGLRYGLAYATQGKLTVNGRKIETFVDLLRILSQNRGDNVVLTYVRPVAVPQGLSGL